MKISELARKTGVPVATVKYYLREGLLPAGEPLSRTSADYGQAHVDRVRLVRALTEVGGLSLATTRRVLTVIEDPGLDPQDVMGVAARSLYGEGYVEVPPEEDEPRGEAPSSHRRTPPSRGEEWVSRRGWQVDLRDPAVDDLDQAWAACETADLGLDEERLDRYADAAEIIAGVDVGSVPEEPSAAVRQVVLGTVLVEPVLEALRRLAQQHTAVSQHGPHTR